MNDATYRVSGLSFMMALLAVLLGCQTARREAATQSAFDPPPGWVLSTPMIEGKLCAVGISEPTYYRDDGRHFAAQNARKELSRALSVEIRSVMLEVTKEKGGHVVESTFEQATSWVTEAVLENAEVVAYWYDADGAVSRKKGVTYCLCCIPRELDRGAVMKSFVSGREMSDDMKGTVSEAVDKINKEEAER